MLSIRFPLSGFSADIFQYIRPVVVLFMTVLSMYQRMMVLPSLVLLLLIQATMGMYELELRRGKLQSFFCSFFYVKLSVYHPCVVLLSLVGCLRTCIELEMAFTGMVESTRWALVEYGYLFH